MRAVGDPSFAASDSTAGREEFLRLLAPSISGPVVPEALAEAWQHPFRSPMSPLARAAWWNSEEDDLVAMLPALEYAGALAIPLTSMPCSSSS